MNMQAQLQAALDAATADADKYIEEIEKTQPLDDREKNFIRKHEALHAEYQTTGEIQEDDTSPVAQPAAETNDDDVSTWKHVSEVLPDAAKATVQIKSLAEKAMLVTLKMSRYGTTKLDRDETAAYGGSHNVYKSLFSGSNNRVKKANSAFNAVYTYLKENTVPWAKGVDMINSDQYLPLTTKIRTLKADARAAVEDLLTNLEAEIAADMNYRQSCAASTGKGHIISRADYPSLDEMRSKYSIDVQIGPVPKPTDFDPRHGVSEEDIASLQRQLDDAATNGGKHVIKQMLEPMEKAVVNLSTPVEDVKKFYSSIVTNMVDVADRMRRANISDDPAISQRIHELTTLSTGLNRNTDVLRHSHTARSAAVNDISTLMGKMQGLV
jgi:hypothetical protein